MRIKDEVYKGGLRVTVSEDRLREVIERAYGLPEAANLEAIFGEEGAENLLQVVRDSVVDAIDEHLRDLSTGTLHRHIKSAEARAVATAQI